MRQSRLNQEQIESLLRLRAAYVGGVLEMAAHPEDELRGMSLGISMIVAFLKEFPEVSGEQIMAYIDEQCGYYRKNGDDQCVGL